MRTFIAGAALLLLLAGCSGSPAPEPSFGLHDQAVDIARAVKACRAASSQPLVAGGSGVSSGVSSVATCLINGSQVDFVVWTDLDAQASDGPVATSTTEGYIAHGDGWDAVTHDSGRVSAQRVIANAIVDSVGGAVVHVHSG